MMRYVISFCCFVVALRAANIAPSALRTEYRTNPLGLDVTQPRLSWEVVARPVTLHGARQTAYRILVASSADRLTPGAAETLVLRRRGLKPHYANRLCR
jgi:hypothetical protein